MSSVRAFIANPWIMQARAPRRHGLHTGHLSPRGGERCPVRSTKAPSTHRHRAITCITFHVPLVIYTIDTCSYGQEKKFLHPFAYGIAMLPLFAALFKQRPVMRRGDEPPHFCIIPGSRTGSSSEGAAVTLLSDGQKAFPR